MSKIFFTADHHFYHENIIKYTNRPYKNVDDMNNSLIENWNSMIDDEDLVYHLGDFTLGDKKDAREIFELLKGQIKILGNRTHHDRRWLPNNPCFRSGYKSLSDTEVEILPPIYQLTFDNYKPNGDSLFIVLCHFPLAEWERKHYGAVHLHGHSHGNYHQENEFILDVGVDVQKYFPISLEKILEWYQHKDMRKE